MSYEEVRKFRKNRKQLLVNACGGKCQKCGYNTCIEALEFHHIDPKQKDFTIAAKIMSLDACVKELKKCVMVCCRCHRELHSELWELDFDSIFDESVIDSYLLKSKNYRDCEKCGLEFEVNKCNTKRFCSERCRRLSSRKVDRPTKKTLAKEIQEYTWVALGKKYGVSDNAVKKWAKHYGLY